MDQDATWYRGRPRPRRHCVRWGAIPLPQEVGGPPPQFSAHVNCGQTTGWIKVALGMEVGLGTMVGLGTGHIVLDGDQAPPKKNKKGAEPPPQISAHVYCGQTAGWIKVALGMQVALVQATLC